MMKKTIFSNVLAFILCLSLATGVFASSVFYLPNVTSEMSNPSYWTNDTKILMTYDEIESLNALTVAQNGTNMYNLKNQPETVNGVSLNEALLKSAAADVAYYLGWTYIDKNTVASEEDFADFINNTQNPNAKNNQSVLYGIAVKRTELLAFPTDKPIYDDPTDKDFNYQYLSGIRVNEPLVITSVSADGKYYLAKNICCSGWVPSNAVAICSNKTEWLSAWDIPPKKTLVVYGDKVYTETSNTGKETSNLMLTQGTVLELADIENTNTLIDNRAPYQNYAVWLPVRNDDGGYEKKLTLISEHSKVNEGYLPLTRENIAKVAFSSLGNVYGWGGSLNSDDCSGYIRSIYKCFGLELARNTIWQTAMPMAKANMQYMCREEKTAFLNALPLGTILYFNGHEMLYLGKENGNYYVISSVSSVMQPENPSVRLRMRSVVINTLDIKRANGNSWLDDLTTALIPYQTEEKNSLPSLAWYHYGVEFCLKNKLITGDDNGLFNPNKNITLAELLQILYNMEENKNDNPQKSGEKWYHNAVEWAKNTNVILENAENFDASITREELVTVIYRYAKSKGLNTNAEYNLSSYSDVNEISENALSAIKYALKNGIINGKTQTTVSPKENITRAETAEILKRLLENNE